MSRKILLLFICFATLFTAAVSADPVIEANLFGDVFSPGEIITVKIDMKSNPGFHGTFFDLEYDGTILAFEDISAGLMVKREQEESNFLYAVSDPFASGRPGNHLIVSYSLKDPAIETKETGTMAEIRFRVTSAGTPDTPYNITFHDAGVYDGSGTELTGAIWNDSPDFYLGSVITGAYITIMNPYGNQVFFDDQALVDAICSSGAGFTVILENLETATQTSPVAADSGSITDVPVSLVFGTNRITAYLYDDAGILIATDVLTVYRSEDDKFIKIISPVDHALVNTDMVKVKVESTFPGVVVKNVTELTAEPLNINGAGGHPLYMADEIWLKPGFNTITATVEGTGNAIYTDTITLYYHKEDSVFRILTPVGGEKFKSGDALNIKGEIGTIHDTEVTLDVIFYPRNPNFDQVIIGEGLSALITETDIPSALTRAPYMFSLNSIVIPENLDSGKIEITAYKNKDGLTRDDGIHKIVYVDNQELSINLIQPNTGGTDILDSTVKLNNFKGPAAPILTDTQLTETGAFTITADNTIFTEEGIFADKEVKKILPTVSGDLYAMVNENYKLGLYKKSFGESGWVKEAIDTDLNLYGYDICETTQGLLLGVSNKDLNGNSGLYLLNEDKSLTNIRTGHPAAHVQYIQNNNGTIYLYGNGYSHLYSFNLYSLEKEGENLKASVTNMYPFDNNLFISDFILSRDSATALILDNRGYLTVHQNLSGTEYLPVDFNDSRLEPDDTIKKVVKGEYRNGDYNTYFIIKEDLSALSIMENKNSHRLVLNEIDLSAIAPAETLVGAAFLEDSFIFLHYNGSAYNIRKGQILFNSLEITTESPIAYTPLGGAFMNEDNLNLLATPWGSYFTGYNSLQADKKIYNLSSTYKPTGTALFSYKNDDIEGISGFQWQSDRVWLESANIEFGFEVKNSQDDSLLFDQPQIPLNQLLAIQYNDGDKYKITHSYNYETGKEDIFINFSELLQEGYIDFKVKLDSSAATSPELSLLTIKKKVIIKLPAYPDEEVILPIKGFISDPTVSEVSISGSKPIPVNSDGSFFHNLPLTTGTGLKTVELTCENSRKETAQLSFTVELFESTNEIKNITIENAADQILTDSAGKFETNTETIKISGDYFGLTGVIAGYEIYVYTTEGDPSTARLVRSGVFEKNVDPVIDPEYASSGNGGAGYETGSFEDQEIQVVPGPQRIDLYVENSDGYRTVYASEDNPVIVTYTLDPEDQKIKITDDELKVLLPTEEVNTILFNQTLTLSVWESTDSPYEFKRSYILTGEVKALDPFKDLKVKSFSPWVTFENGTDEFLTEVNSFGRFQVTININLPEESAGETCHIAFIPTAPYQEWMKKGLRIEAQKEFEDTHIIPDFSLMDPSATPWKQNEIDTREKPVRVKFSRFIPPGTRIKLTANFNMADSVSGELVEIDSGLGIYKVMEDLQEISLTKIKTGITRVQWSITYQGDTISHSNSGKLGMNDFIFTYTPSGEYTETLITFPVEIQTYYDTATLPDLSITKDLTTYGRITLNDSVIWEDTNKETAYTNDWNETTLLEGRNVISVYFLETDSTTDNGNEVTQDYVFLFDTLKPVVTIASYEYDAGYNHLVKLTALVKESNLNDVELLQGSEGSESIVNSNPVVEYLVDDLYEVRWENLEALDPKLVPTSLLPIKVKAYDYKVDPAENWGISTDFEGVEDINRPARQTSQPVPLTNKYITGGSYPYFENEDPALPGNAREHKKFYNGNVIIQSKTITETSYRLESEDTISIGADQNDFENTRVIVTGNGTSGSHLDVKAKNRASFGPGFSVQKGATLTAGTKTFTPYTHQTITHQDDTDALTIAFWFRYEQEAHYADDTDNLRKILTLYDLDSYEVYLAYENPADRNAGLVLAFENTETLAIIDKTSAAALPVSGPGDEAWQMVLVKVDQVTQRIHVSIDGNAGVGTNFFNGTGVIETILADQADYYFGESDLDESSHDDSGYFSISQPFYINHLISPNEINSLIDETNFTWLDPKPRREYDFNSTGENEGTEFYKLRFNGSDYFSGNENSDYTVTESAGSLKASGLHRNRLKVENNKIIFDDTQDAVLINLNAPQITEGKLKISPKDPDSPGKYFFGNDFGSHDLLNNKWYSVSGIVESDSDQEVDARLVLRINGKEQEMKLKDGDFHFVYSNPALETPKNVVMYIETKTDLKIDTNLCLNEGNYTLPLNGTDELSESYSTTQYLFQSEGTVEFWYKPFNLNRSGYSNTANVLFDSEYIKIGTEIKTDAYCSSYYALLKGDGTIDEVKIETDIPVKPGWQHVQFSYNKTTAIADNAVYFYIDGKMAGRIEEIELPVCDSMTAEDIVLADNVVIGADEGINYFADGYMDDLRLNHFYNDSLYTSRKPLSFGYSDTPEPSLTIGVLNGSSHSEISESRLILESVYGDFREIPEQDTITSSTGHGLNIKALDPGAYTLYAKMKINDFNYEEVFSFVKDDRPAFIIKEVTPLIIKGLESDIEFKLGYDNSHLINSTASRWAGMAFEMTWLDSDNNSVTEVIYLVQNFEDQNKTEWKTGNGVDGIWTDLTVNGNNFNILFEKVLTNGAITWRAISFYFDNIFDYTSNNFETLESDLTTKGGTVEEGTISEAHLTPTIVQSGDTQYKLDVQVGSGEGELTPELADNISIGYQLFKINTEEGNDIIETTATASGIKNVNNKGFLEFYYDDILPAYGKYQCVLTLNYLNEPYGSEVETLVWKKQTDEVQVAEEKRLDIIDFSLLYMDKAARKARVYLEYDQNALSAGLYYDLIIIPGEETGFTYSQENMTLSTSDRFVIIKNIDIPDGSFTAKMTVYSTADGLSDKAEFSAVNSTEAPDIVMTNTVPSLISYNNVMFSWKGTLNGQSNSEILYSYNFDNKGWIADNTSTTRLELFNLEEGYHKLEVRAKSGDTYSPIETVTFFVDMNKPVFNNELIAIEELYDTEGIKYALNVTGSEGAIEDASLTNLFLNGIEVDVTETGEFIAPSIPLTTDGSQELLFTAFDRVGNFTEHTIIEENSITELLFPDLETQVQYAPAVITGKIDENIYSGLEIYLFDPECLNKGTGDYSGWKKAKINEDRTYFIEDVFITPGTREREAYTDLIQVVKFASGLTFTKEIQVKANTLTMPIELDISAHAVEGDNTGTEITINCSANIEKIASWSIDFTGDGIYDLVDIAGASDNARTHSWTHTYSSLGLVKPRVRVITLNGSYFSVSDEIIIHEKIKEASNKIIDNPIALSVVSMPDLSERVFILAGSGNNTRVEVYEIGRNASYLSDRLYTITLNDKGIENPVGIKALDKDNLLITANRNSKGYIYQLRANQYGNYRTVTSAETEVNSTISEIDGDSSILYITLENSSQIGTVPLEDNTLDPANLSFTTEETDSPIGLSSNMGIAKDNMGLLVADYYNQRIVRLTDNLTAQQFTGAHGNGEGQFLKPEIIKSHENRVFVYDDSRYDVQVFDMDFKPITTLSYNTDPAYSNYLEQDFLLDLADMGVVTKEENGLLYYYALLLSKSKGKLAMLRLPQWEELRARVRNNKIVFLKDREVFTAKPDGSDLKKIISSDSLPRIEGTLDYPALSPDGKTLVFTSRLRLYNGSADGAPAGDEYAYDNLYVINAETGENLTRIPLGAVNQYEIERPVFNSNGDKLIFSAKPIGGRWQLYTYEFASGGIAQLFSSEENARFPYFSPDDRFVVFTTDYDGDEEIEIFDTENPTVRVSVTTNSARDSFPVWNTVYPFEIANQDLDIESKISFVSERDYHKGVYYTYIARPSDSDVRVVTSAGVETAGDPDSAAIEITSASVEGDYPAFTGDGKGLVFEHFYGQALNLKHFDFEATGSALTDINLPEGSKKPAGMKNTIANFQAEAMNGDEVKLSWTRYTDTDIFYTVRFKKNSEGEPYVQKKIFTQDGTTLKGLEMGVEYLFKISIIENNEEVAATQWKEVQMPKVAARPSYEIDPDNPYLVKFTAWTPEEETSWNFNWIIDNQSYPVQQSTEFLYEFATGGTKTVMLKTSDAGNQHTAISSPITIEIISDIQPVIEYTLADDASYIELMAGNSKGNKIDWASAAWTISGPGRQPMPPVTGTQTIIPLDGFLHKINVNLTLRRMMVTGQPQTDTLEKNIIVDLDFKDVKPVITPTQDKINNKLFYFSGEDSLGNIDWTRAQWNIFADSGLIHRVDGVSTISYQFPENSQNINYSVTLTVPRRNDGMTETASHLVAVEAAPIEPEIDYEILELTNGNNVTGAKIIFSCGNSKGSNIDYTQARWTVPVAGSYSEQPSQIGPTAVYNLFDVSSLALMEVSLTLTRRGGTDPVTVTKMIKLKAGDLPKTELNVNVTDEEAATGVALVFDVLSSTGPNIDWEKTEWLLDGQYARKGPVARLDLPNAAEDRRIPWVCTLYRHGAEPIIKKDVVNLDKTEVEPLISLSPISAEQPNVYELNVMDTPGIGIDWERTMWYIYDGNENVTQKQGPAITHAFALKSEALGYPVMVEMFFKGSSRPFMGYKNVDVEGDEFVPVIEWDTNNTSEPNVINFTAQNSIGGNIDWSSAKWTFGDSSEAQYGASAVHKYAVNSEKRTYKASLTLSRRSVNGSFETKTTYKTITIGGAEISPVMKVTYADGTLFLTAEESEGRGLLLDRSVWLFEGSGDSETYSEKIQGGTIKTTNGSWDINAYIKAYVKGGTAWGSTTESDNGGWGGFFEAGGEAGTGTSWAYTDNTKNLDYSEYQDDTNTFTNSNAHTGTVCRKNVNVNEKNLYVTLFVYRMNADGSTDGSSITVNINIDNVKTATGGVVYGN